MIVVGKPAFGRLELPGRIEARPMPTIELVDMRQEFLETRKQATFSRKLVGYALGRTLLPSDQPLIDRMVGAGGNTTIPQLAAEIVASKLAADAADDSGGPRSVLVAMPHNSRAKSDPSRYHPDLAPVFREAVDGAFDGLGVADVELEGEDDVVAQFIDQLLELVFQRICLAVLGLRFIGLLLQQVCSFLVLGVISFQFFHIRQQLRVLPLNSFDLIEWFEIVE